MAEVVIVGAGPAGVAAAGVLAGRAAVTLVDEASRPGGQVYRTPHPGLDLDMDALLGTGAAAYRGFHTDFAAVRGRIAYRPDTLAWNVHGGSVHLVSVGAQSSLRYDALLLATGATDRVAPLPGWTLPGVYALGGAQAVLKDQGLAIGREVVFCGSSPLLYLAARQYAGRGLRVTVLDTTPLAAKLRAAPRLAATGAGTLAKGLRDMIALRRGGVAVHHGVRLLAFEGTEGVEAVRFHDAGGAEHRQPCDAVAYGYGLRPEAQLAEVAGCEMRFDPVQRGWFPAADALGRCGNGLYVAGDGAAIGGAEAAVLAGRLAAGAILADLGLSDAPPDPAALRRLAARQRFQDGIARAFAWPAEAVAATSDDVPVCRCEDIPAGALRTAARVPIGAGGLNRVKAATRCGMGRCQGRFCGPAAAEIVAAATGEAPERLRAQPPVKPIPVASAALEEGWP